MAAKKQNAAMDFIVDALKGNRNAKYADVAEAASKKKLKIWPIMWGRAQALLGYVKVAPRGQGKMARAKRAAAGKVAGGGKRGPGRPRKASSSFDGTIEGIVAAVKSGEQAKTRYRAALEKIQTILADTLG